MEYLFITVYHIYQPLRSGRIGHKVNFKQSLTGLNSEFSFLISFLTKAVEPSLPYYLPVTGGKVIALIPFPRVLVPCEMQSVSSSIWTRVADNHYTMGMIYYSSYSFNFYTLWIYLASMPPRFTQLMKLIYRIW